MIARILLVVTVAMKLEHSIQKTSIYSLCGCPAGYYENSSFLVYTDPKNPVKCGTRLQKTNTSQWAINASYCRPCHPTCSQCLGPSDTECTSCAADLFKAHFKVTEKITMATEPMSASTLSMTLATSYLETDDDETTSEVSKTTLKDGSFPSTSLLTTEELILTTIQDKVTRQRLRRGRSVLDGVSQEVSIYRVEDADESSGDVESSNYHSDELVISIPGESEDVLEDDVNSAVQVNKREYPITQDGDEIISSYEKEQDAFPFSTPHDYTAMSLTLNRKEDKQPENSKSRSDLDNDISKIETTPPTTQPPTSRPSPRTRHRPSRRRYTRPRTSKKNDSTITTTPEPESEPPHILIIDLTVPDWETKTVSCVAVCPPGTYNEPVTQTCEKCDSMCETCVGPSLFNCTICQGRTVELKPASLKMSSASKQCLSVCPTTHYNHSRVCEQCHPMCDGCKGPNSTHCIRCQKTAIAIKVENGLTTCEAERPDKSLASLEIILPISFVVFLILVTILICVRWHLKFTTLTKPFVTLWIKYIRRDPSNNNNDDIANLSSLPKTATPGTKLRNEYTSDPSNSLCAKCGTEKTDDGYELPVPSSNNTNQGSPFKSQTTKSRRNNDPLPPTPDEAIRLEYPEMYINQSSNTTNSKPSSLGEPTPGGSREPTPQPGTSRMYTITTDNPYSNSEGLYANC